MSDIKEMIEEFLAADASFMADIERQFPHQRPPMEAQLELQSFRVTSALALVMFALRQIEKMEADAKPSGEETSKPAASD